ncbi:hypothetical protein [Streptomyces sp. NBC_01275]|uniref:hypothetical protein n=1 Tax=Streptomyces sp. NBC_01275 TaxID=2903807 RepID=UPI002B1E5FD3|nr:hypothetical protein [Streptomyces sp. NBC_01275]
MVNDLFNRCRSSARASGQGGSVRPPAHDDASGVGRRAGMPAIAQPVQADEDAVRDAIHRFNEIGLTCLDPDRVPAPCRLDVLAAACKERARIRSEKGIRAGGTRSKPQPDPTRRTYAVTAPATIKTPAQGQTRQ